MNILAFVNQKGGVGKTTTCLNVGAGLARSGKKVLLIDTDPQGSLTISAGFNNLGENDLTVYEVLKGTADINDAIIVKNTDHKYSILPTDIRLSGAEIELANIPGREMLLKEAIETLKVNYDYILIDCPPSLSIITIMGLTACTKVIIPVQSQYLALNGMAQLIETINLVKKRMNPQIEIGGVLATLYDSRKLLDQEVLQSITEAFPDKAFKTTIGNSVALAEAPSFGKDIFEYKPCCKGAFFYSNLVNEILERENQK